MRVHPHQLPSEASMNIVEHWKKGIAAALAIAAVAAPVSAGTGQGTIGSILTGRLGYQVFVQITGASFNGFACGTPSTGSWQFAFMTQNQGGKDMLATLLSAKAMGLQVIMVGGGTCSQDAALEDVNYIITL
jgi:hypothetical protein